MAEIITSPFVRLFEVRLLHHYWLDEGALVFDRLADAKREARLLDYDARSIFDVKPTPSTADRLGGLGLFFKRTALGFVVAAPRDATIPTDTNLKFAVTVTGRGVLDYTAMTFRPQAISALRNPAPNAADPTVHRYKANVPVLSNATGVSRTIDGNAGLFLSREIPAATPADQIEALVVSGNALMQLTSDNPSATTQQLGPDATGLPAYVHQGDAPSIVPPAGIAGAPARGVELSAELPDDVFAVINLFARRANNDAFSFVDANGAPRATAPIYQVRFKNRSTIWTYLDQQTGIVEITEANPLPLTYFGNANSNRQKPSHSAVKAQFSGDKITRLVSELYV